MFRSSRSRVAFPRVGAPFPDALRCIPPADPSGNLRESRPIPALRVRSPGADPRAGFLAGEYLHRIKSKASPEKLVRGQRRILEWQTGGKPGGQLAVAGGENRRIGRGNCGNLTPLNCFKARRHQDFRAVDILGIPRGSPFRRTGKLEDFSTTSPLDELQNDSSAERAILK